MKYYKLKEDKSFGDRWHLSKVLDPDGGVHGFYTGKRIEGVEKLTTRVSYPGPALDYCLTSFGVPVVCARLASAINDIAPDNVQLLPLEFQGQGAGYFAVNVIRVVDALNHELCKGHWDLEKRRFTAMHVVAMFESRVAPDAHFFAPLGYRHGIIVSAAMRDVFLAQKVVGAVFEDVILT